MTTPPQENEQPPSLRWPGWWILPTLLLASLLAVLVLAQRAHVENQRDAEPTKEEPRERVQPKQQTSGQGSTP